MRLQLLLVVGILSGISIQAVASNIVKAPYPVPPSPPKAPAVPTATSVPVRNVVLPPTATFTPIVSHNVFAVPTSTATSTPNPSAVTVWPTVSKGGQSILFKAPSDKGTPIQLSIHSQSGQPVFQTTFSKTGRSGGHVWRLQNQSGAPVAGGVYVYVLSFKQQGQSVTAQGKVTVVR